MVFGLLLASLHNRDPASAVRLSVAIENGQVHERVVENVSHDSRERLSALARFGALGLRRSRYRSRGGTAPSGWSFRLRK